MTETTVRKATGRDKRNAGGGSIQWLDGHVGGRARIRTPLFYDPALGKKVQRAKITTGNVRKVEQDLRDFIAEVQAATPAEGSSAETVGHFLRRWILLYPHLPSKRGGRRPAPGTVLNYRLAVKNYLDLPPFNAIRLDQVTTKDVNALIAFMGKARVDDDGNPCLGPGGVKKVRTVLSSAFTFARKNGLMVNNPIPDANWPAYEVPELPIPTSDDVRRLIESAKALDPESTMGRLGVGEALILEARTGMRRSEVCGLQVRDFDADTRSLRI
ncbi:MAG: tyrosine-type recombinase/integrase, partial [Acidimicrobiales bacterium]